MTHNRQTSHFVRNFRPILCDSAQSQQLPHRQTHCIQVPQMHFPAMLPHRQTHCIRVPSKHSLAIMPHLYTRCILFSNAAFWAATLESAPMLPSGQIRWNFAPMLPSGQTRWNSRQCCLLGRHVASFQQCCLLGRQVATLQQRCLLGRMLEKPLTFFSKLLLGSSSKLLLGSSHQWFYALVLSTAGAPKTRQPKMLSHRASDRRQNGIDNTNTS